MPYYLKTTRKIGCVARNDEWIIEDRRDAESLVREQVANLVLSELHLVEVDADEAERLKAIAELQNLDSNGVWTDEDCEAEGRDPLTLADARQAVARLRMEMPDAETLANEFTIVIREWLTPEQCREIDRRNKTEQYTRNNLCASHDFCDANQAMIDALGRFNIEYESQDERQGVLIDQAWSIAKRQGFGTDQ
jgi:hypothetical protein